jgi:hypothetical protein
MWQQQVSISFQKLKAFVHTSLQGLFIIIIIISFFLSFFLSFLLPDSEILHPKKPLIE